MLALQVLFWLCATLIVWTQAGYAAALAAVVWLRPRQWRSAVVPPRERTPESVSSTPPSPPALTLIIAAHDEQAVIAEKVANALALDYPRELLQVIVACDGCTDATARLAAHAGA